MLMLRRIFFLFLWKAQIVFGQLSILYDQSTVYIEERASNALYTNWGYAGDRCRKLITRQNTIYHLGHDSIIQSWSKHNYTTNSVSLTNFLNTVTDFFVNSEEVSVQGLISNSTSSYFQIDSLDGNMTFMNSTQVPPTPSQVFMLGQNIFYFYQSHYFTDAIYDGSIYTTIASLNGTVYVSPGGNLFVVANPTGIVYLYNSSFILLHTYFPTNPTFGTISIVFDYYSQNIIIQTDADNLLLVASVRTDFNYRILYSVNYTGQTGSTSIKIVSFVDMYKTYIMIWGNNGRHLYDTRSGLLHDASSLLPDTDVMTGGYNNRFYLCKGNTLKVYGVSYGLYTGPLPTDTDDDQEEEDTQIDQTAFYMPVLENTADEHIKEGVRATIVTVNQMSMFLANSPFLIYFLGFLNYISLSSLYILLELPIPQHLYFYLKLLYANLNEDLLERFGLSEEIDPISPELVNRQRPLFFGISSDMISSSWSDTSIACINLALLLIINFIFSRLLQSKCIIRSFFQTNKWEMVMGQIINLLVPYLLPLSFFFFQPHNLGVSGKVNAFLLLTALFIGIFFPIYYLFFLLHQQRKKVANQNTVLMKERGLKRLMKLSVLTQWFACLANSLYPLLVLLKKPIYFLVLVGIFTLLNSLIYFRSISTNKNSFLLSLYPLIFHFSFFIFNYSSSPTLILYTELIAVFSLLIGLVHNALTATIKMVFSIAKIFRKLLMNNQVNQQPQQNGEQEKKRSVIVLKLKQENKNPSQGGSCKSTREQRKKNSQLGIKDIKTFRYQHKSIVSSSNQAQLGVSEANYPQIKIKKQRKPQDFQVIFAQNQPTEDNAF